MRGFLFFAVLNALVPFSAQGVEKEAADEKVERQSNPQADALPASAFWRAKNSWPAQGVAGS